jgi:hypothetical protein
MKGVILVVMRSSIASGRLPRRQHERTHPRVAKRLDFQCSVPHALIAH